MKISITLETRTIRRSCILLFWLFIWELCSLFINNPLILPSPFEVIKTLFILAKGIYFWKSVFNSIIRVISGILISIIVGIVLGVAAGLNKFIEEILDPIIITMKATPVMSIIIIALIWFTSSYVVIFTAILICFPIVYTNVIQGIKSVDKNLIQMASVYRVKKKYLLKDIYLPSIKNYVVSGILMCLSLIHI